MFLLGNEGARVGTAYFRTPRDCGCCGVRFACNANAHLSDDETVAKTGHPDCGDLDTRICGDLDTPALCELDVECRAGTQSGVGDDSYSLHPLVCGFL